jgi:hypothetical protein
MDYPTFEAWNAMILFSMIAGVAGVVALAAACELYMIVADWLDR